MLIFVYVLKFPFVGAALIGISFFESVFGPLSFFLYILSFLSLLLSFEFLTFFIIYSGHPLLSYWSLDLRVPEPFVWCF